MYLLLVGFVYALHQHHHLSVCIKQLLQAKTIDGALLIQRMHQRPGEGKEIDLVDLQGQGIEFAFQHAFVVALIERHHDLHFCFDQFTAQAIAHTKHECLAFLKGSHEHVGAENDFGLRARKTPIQQPRNQREEQKAHERL